MAPNPTNLQVLVASTAPNAINQRFSDLHGHEPYKSTSVGGLHGPKLYKLIKRFGGIHGPEPYESTNFGGAHSPKRYELKVWWHPRPRTIYMHKFGSEI